MGSVNGNDDIKVDSSNKVNINFELGNNKNNMDGTIKFQTQNGQVWDSSFNGRTSANKFKATSLQGKGNNNEIRTGAVSGNFYGKDAQAVGGTFQLNTNKDKATGVFKATK